MWSMEAQKLQGRNHGRFSIPIMCCLLIITIGIFTLSSLFAQTASIAPNQQKQVVRVPFVGCKSDGQVGPVEAPKGNSKVIATTADVAQRLAYYKAAYGFGVLAPRGWYCFETYGSNGSTLFVSPEPINPSELFTGNWKGFAGQVIQISNDMGDTSGRFSVARIIARVFPAHKAFVKDVIAEGIEPASSFPSGPYPNDKLTYRSNDIVEFQTPSNTEGLGTSSWLKKNGIPISGVAILFGQELNLLQLSVRLSPNLINLTPIIIQQVETDVAQIKQ
jgi:hypothetical protein